MKPSAYYLEQIKAHGMVEDASQLAILQHFDRLYDELTIKKNLSTKLKSYFKPTRIKGMYLWGEVGRGKTFLVDCFVDCLNSVPKTRLHFHQFMRQVHEELKQMQGSVDPLKKIAKKFSREFKVLCLDEFIVSDITDAMILGELLAALFAEGVCLVTTSNTVPNQSYNNGLQRERFLAAIKLLEQQTEVLHLRNSKDYRLRHLSQAGVYYTPLNAQSAQKMQATFATITQGHAVTQNAVEVLGRKIHVLQRSTHAIWFDYNELCGTQRSQNDYLVLAKQFPMMFMSDIPVITAKQRDLVINFIKLIDVLYDNKIRLIISAAANPLELYPEGPEAAQYQRTASRLIEMLSSDYFA